MSHENQKRWLWVWRKSQTKSSPWRFFSDRPRLITAQEHITRTCCGRRTKSSPSSKSNIGKLKWEFSHTHIPRLQLSWFVWVLYLWCDSRSCIPRAPVTCTKTARRAVRMQHNGRKYFHIIGNQRVKQAWRGGAELERVATEQSFCKAAALANQIQLLRKMPRM